MKTTPQSQGNLSVTVMVMVLEDRADVICFSLCSQQIHGSRSQQSLADEGTLGAGQPLRASGRLGVQDHKVMAMYEDVKSSPWSEVKFRGGVAPGAPIVARLLRE